MTIDQVAAIPTEQSKPFNQDIAHQASKAEPLWLHFRLQAEQASSSASWTVELSRSYIDRAEFYTRTAQGAWQMQAAGDHMAHLQWPVRSLNPQFRIPVLQAGANDFYMRVFNETPLHFSANVQPTDTIQLQNQHTFLLTGLMLGLMLVMFALSCVMALAYRQLAYAWYAVYVVAVFFCSASFVGIANYAFWPSSPLWANYSRIALMMVAMGLQTQFCRAMFLSSTTPPWIQHCITALLVLTAVAVWLYVGSPHLVFRHSLFIATDLIHIGVMLCIVLPAIWQRSIGARLWCLAYAPLLLVLIFTVVDNLGWAAIPWMPYHAPMYALIFEIPVLLIALHLHAKAEHAQDVHKTTLASTDPMTGFVSAPFFQNKAQQLWTKAQHDKQDMAVAYIEAKSDGKRPLHRTVRLLRTVVRDGDTVAHIQRNRFALFMPGASIGEDLANRLSRLVALGYMTDKDHANTGPVRFRIVASSVGSFTGSWLAMDDALEEKIRQSEGWGQRNILYVKHQSHERFEELWMRAVKESTSTPTTA